MKSGRLKEYNLKDCIGERISIVFMARDVEVKDQKNGDKYINLMMVDNGKIVPAKRFSASAADIENLVEGTVIKATVDVKPYDKSSDGYSCIIYNFDKTDLSPRMFVEWAPGLDRCKQLIESTLAEYYEHNSCKIAMNLLSENWNRFSVWPAAKTHHHNILGGLMLHTSEVLSLCKLLADYSIETYGEQFVNKPLLFASACIHDIGKVREYDVDEGSGKTDYSTHATLETHIMDGIAMIENMALRMGLGVASRSKSAETVEEEREEIELLQHCIGAHHGKLEYGSPITPSTPEAYILNVADGASADLFKFNSAFKDIEAGEAKSIWYSSGISNYYKDSSKISFD